MYNYESIRANKQQLLHSLTSQVEQEVIDYIRQEIQHDAPDSIPTADELLTFFRSPDEPTELDTYQQMLVTDKLLEYAEISLRTVCDLIRYQQLKELGVVHSAKGVHSILPSRRIGGQTMSHFPNKNYFTMPNEIFSLGLDASEIAVYAYLRCLESRSSYQCWPSYTTIGNAVGRAKNTVMRYVDALAEKGLIYTEPTSVLMKSESRRTAICATPSDRSVKP